MVTNKTLVLLFVMGAAAFVVLQTQLDWKNPSVVIVAMLFASVGYITWKWVEKERRTSAEEDAKVKTILEQAGAKDDIGQTLIKSNPLLGDCLQRLQAFASIDKGSYDHLIRLLNDYYTLYAQILMGNAAVENNMLLLIEMRKQMMDLFEHVKLQRHWIEDDSTFNMIQSKFAGITGACISVLKNKYARAGETASYPLPSNVLLDSV